MSALKVAGTLSAELQRPEDATALLILAHGAGADYQHANMRNIADAMAAVGIATLRFNFPFMNQGKRRVDSQADSVAAIVAAVATAAEAAPDLPLFLGGHSFGGRMASHAAALSALPVRGMLFCAFPLHPPNKPGITRAAHLSDVTVPMLFLSGSRDALATADLLEGMVADLGPRAQLHWLATADHSYKILKRQRSDAEDVFAEMARVASSFVSGVLAG